MFHKGEKVHFVGVGGIGMSGIAAVAAKMGCRISGSDLEINNLTKGLRMMGGDIHEGHSSRNIRDGTDVVVYSSSISADNPEIVTARKRGIRIIHRAEALAGLLNTRDGIAVTGTHGKTTTTSLISVMLEKCGLDPTAIIGGEIGEFGGNARLGNGTYLVAEADESDSSFLRLKPLYSVITNIEAEHLDHFKSLRQILAAYRAFADNLKNGGMLFHNIDDWNVKDALKGFRKRRGTFGLSSEADLSAVSIRMNGFETSFICTRKCRKLGEVRLKIPGLHNVLNSLAAISVGLELGLGFEKIRDAIRDFGGVKRRFQLRADAGGAMLIDDYAHHPTEIEAVLKTCRRWSGRRVIAVFQPHRYTRTKLLADSFGKCFKNADKLILTDIYAASEKPIKGVSIRTIRDKVVESGFNNVEIVKKERIADRVMGFKKPGDMIVVMGAGDIKKIADELAERLNGAPETALLSKLKRLVKGNILFSEPLCRHTSFGIGGPAAVWVEPADTGDLRRVLIYAKKKGLPLFVIGGGTKMLVSDRGFRGIAVHLGSDAFKRVRIKGNVVKVGAGFNMSRLVKLCCESAIAGLESLVGIPGTIGGAIYMNAGGAANPIYRNIGGFVRSVKVMDYSGGVRNLGKDDLKFGYRCSNLEKYIILEATLGLKKGDAALLNSSCRRFLNIKKEKQVLDMPSAGCVFKNPRDVQFTCGQMIDMLGLKGTMRGAAAISGKHANFIVNIGKASSDDVLELIGLIRDKVKKSFNIPLELEIKVI